VVPVPMRLATATRGAYIPSASGDDLVFDSPGFRWLPFIPELCPQNRMRLGARNAHSGCRQWPSSFFHDEPSKSVLAGKLFERI